MNNPEALDILASNPGALQFGLGTLHSWIRCVEHILHVAYRLDIQVWRVPGGENPQRASVQANKARIQRDLRLHLGEDNNFFLFHGDMENKCFRQGLSSKR